MLTTRRPLLALGVLQPVSRLPQKQTQSTMARATRTIWVKGDPQQQLLGDCPFCHRAMLTLELKGLEYNKEFVDFSDKPQWIKDLTENGTVPVMKDGEKLVADSGDICSYLSETYPKPDLGKCTLEGTADKLFPSFVQFLTSKGDEAQEKENALVGQLQELSEYLEKTGPYLGGQEMMAYDCMIFPRLYHLTTALDHYKGWKMPDKFSNLGEYIDRVKQTDAFKNTDYGQDMILKGWKPKVESA